MEELCFVTETEKLNDEVPFQRIITDIRTTYNHDADNADKNDGLQRTYLIDAKALHDITKQLSVNQSIQKHRNDSASINIWIEEKKKLGDKKFYFSKIRTTKMWKPLKKEMNYFETPILFQFFSIDTLFINFNLQFFSQKMSSAIRIYQRRHSKLASCDSTVMFIDRIAELIHAFSSHNELLAIKYNNDCPE